MSDEYSSPEVVEYGTVESMTEARNKASLGTDQDITAIDLKGSTDF
ncbi:putative RiPP precursor [Halomontanus rarus]|nr:putative RiPP precursor [Halovivax sp. TS33]